MRQVMVLPRPPRVVIRPQTAPRIHGAPRPLSFHTQRGAVCSGRQRTGHERNHGRDFVRCFKALQERTRSYRAEELLFHFSRRDAFRFHDATRPDCRTSSADAKASARRPQQPRSRRVELLTETLSSTIETSGPVGVLFFAFIAVPQPDFVHAFTVWRARAGFYCTLVQDWP